MVRQGQGTWQALGGWGTWGQEMEGALVQGRAQEALRAQCEQHGLQERDGCQQGAGYTAKDTQMPPHQWSERSVVRGPKG